LPSQLETINQSLVEVDRRFRALHKKRQTVLEREWKPAMDAAELEALGQQISAVEPQEYAALHATLDTVCDYYLAASEVEREALRLHLGIRPDALSQMLNHINWAAGRATVGEVHQWILRGLAAASLQDNRISPQEIAAALGELYLAGSRAGIQVGLCFQDVAALSNPIRGRHVHAPPMHEMLAGFEHSTYFQENVKPKLPS
jgi:hypothetical protein